MSAYTGFLNLRTSGDDLSAYQFIVQQIIGRMPGATLVQVKSVTNAGGIAPVGSVDVQPMVNQVDGAGNAVAHGTIHNLPYFRLQGGANAIILDPIVGDIGIAVFASRDISAVKANKAVSNPGSWRRNDWADGLYIGGVLNGTPTQLIAFAATGIAINTAQNVTISAANVTLDAAGNLTVKGGVTAGLGSGDQVGLQSHKHGTGAAATGTSIPTAGT